MFNTHRLFILIAVVAVSGCSKPADRPQEQAPDATPRSSEKDNNDPGSIPSGRDNVPPGTLSAPRLEDVTPGTFTPYVLSPRFTVYAPFNAPFATIDRDIGRRIKSMYEIVGEQGWTKDGPALVTVRGSLEKPTVSAELTFSLQEAPSNAEDFGLKSGTLPGGLAVIGMHKGPRDRLSETIQGLNDWCQANEMSPRDDLRWFVFLNRPDQVSKDELLTAVIQPIE